MPVSPEIAAALAAKYPHLAEKAAGAEPLEAQEQVRLVGGESVTISRYRKYRVGDQIVSMAEPLPAPVVAVIEKAKAASPTPATQPPIPASLASDAPAHSPTHTHASKGGHKTDK